LGGLVRNGYRRSTVSGSAAIVDSILHKTPVSVMRLNPDLPPTLEEIINKTLDKDRTLRYQSASDIRTDLKRLKRDTESGRLSDQAIESEDHPQSSVPVVVSSSGLETNLAHRKRLRSATRNTWITTLIGAVVVLESETG
jgi:serine/threonine protein kinase